MKKINVSSGNYNDEVCLRPEQKQNTRKKIFEVAKESLTLLDEDGRLCVPVVELCGERAPLYAMIIEEKLIGKGGFYVGVDAYGYIIDECREIYHDSSSEWINSNLGLAISKKSQKDNENVSRAQILVFDSHDGIHKKNFHKGDLPRCIKFAKRQQEKFGEFLLVLNICNSRYSKDNDRDIDRYCKFLTEEVGRKVGKDDFLLYRSKKEEMMWIAISFGF